MAVQNSCKPHAKDFVPRHREAQCGSSGITQLKPKQGKVAQRILSRGTAGRGFFPRFFFFGPFCKPLRAFYLFHEDTFNCQNKNSSISQVEVDQFIGKVTGKIVKKDTEGRGPSLEIWGAKARGSD